jgi:spore coat protein U-like protein
VTLTCTHISGGTERIDWSMVLSNGGSANCNARAMAGPGASLNYNIFQNSVAGGVWGNVACATFPAGQLRVGPGAGNSTDSATRTLFGQIPIGQFVPAGAYSDSLLLTIEYN